MSFFFVPPALARFVIVLTEWSEPGGDGAVPTDRLPSVEEEAEAGIFFCDGEVLLRS